MNGKRALASMLVWTILAGAAAAGEHHVKTLEASVAVAGAFAAAPQLQSLAPALLSEARGVAVIPRVVKGGVIVEGRFGRGVLLVRQPDGSWSQPVFLTLEGGGVGLEVGVEATDLLLVFRSEKSMDRLLKGKGHITLGSDVAIAVGPLGRELEKSTEILRKADVFCYSHSRGLFAGLALEGDKLKIDTEANEACYRIRGGAPAEVLAIHGPAPVPVIESLRVQIGRMCVRGPERK